MTTSSPMKAFLLAIGVTSGALLLSGCEWDNSEDYESTPEENDSPTVEQPDVSEPEEELTPAVSGLVATTEPLEGAIVCLDANDNWVCDSDEAQTVSDAQGEWSITLEDGEPLKTTTNILVENDRPNTLLNDSGTELPWALSIASRVSTEGQPIEGVFVSLMSALVENERQTIVSRSQPEATLNIAGKIRSDIDILENYLTPPADSTTVEDYGYRRLARIVQVADALAVAIDAAVPDTDRDNLSKKELDSRILDKVSAALGQIAEDVDRSLVETPDDSSFDPEIIIQQPEYEDDLEPVNTDPKPPSLTELESRVSTAESNSPYFEEIGFETYPVDGARLFDLHWFENTLIPTLNARRTELFNAKSELATETNSAQPTPPTMREEGLIYYEARRRIAVGTDQDAVIADIQIGAPTNTDYSSDDSTFGVVSEANCTNGDFQCDELTSSPQSVRALAWTGFSFRTETIQVGHSGRQRYLPLLSFGELVANSESTLYSSQLNFGEFSLAGLDARPVIDELVGGKDIPGVGSFTFSPGTLGYTFKEELVSNIILSQWPSGGTGNLCDTPGLPDATETGSCNLVYGAIGQSAVQPAQTFAQALYPVGQQDAAYTSFLEDGKPFDAIAVTGPTEDTFVARLFGSATNDEGVIRLYRQISPGNWETMNIVGRWERPSAAQFERIDLFLPSGFYYTDARIGFELGRAYLFERNGYLRHGWLVPDSVNVDSLYGRKQVKYAFSKSAFDQIIADLDGLDLITEHPFYTRQLIAEMEAEIQATEDAIADARRGGGGQTE